ncbi:BspA family leucine-rich repeat surface protein [Lactobacillus sp. ESL0680]|uniref:BspA family leucine-rich repeat surface protein n=1 Tax=Lactobacillus sp. ESL0680 TaxID=2983210 RepID=UPI0023F81D03|nr:BspA family leucine-rich repeat surface protein [Lactobacillus sp. ESL0680]WEV38743.1 BspA family leucine-rich repeat surface protein [Lactobacillus sp. ESL0680]
MKVTTFKKNRLILLITAITLLGFGSMAVNTTSVNADSANSNTTDFSGLWSGQDGQCDWSYDIVTRTLTISSSSRGSQLSTKVLSGQISGLIPWSGWIEHINFATPVSLAINSGGKFSYLYNLKTIDNFNLVDTSRVVNMAELFSDDENLYKLDLSNLNTSKAANMTNMFNSDKKLTQVDLSKLDTSHVPSAKKKGMFDNSGLVPNTDSVQHSKSAHAGKK